MTTLWPVRALNIIQTLDHHIENSRKARQCNNLIQQTRDVRTGLQNISSNFNPFQAGEEWIKSNILPNQFQRPAYPAQTQGPVYPAQTPCQQPTQPYRNFRPANASIETSVDLRTRLLNQLRESMTNPTDLRLAAVAVERVLNSYPEIASINPDNACEQAELYLHRMEEAKRQLHLTIASRISPSALAKLGKISNVPQAETIALLEFDYFRPVDPEDVFLFFIDELILRLEELNADASVGRGDVEGLLRVLEDATAMSSRSRREDSDGLAAGGKLEEGMGGRKGSIVQTPTRFYFGRVDLFGSLQYG